MLKKVEDTELSPVRGEESMMHAGDLLKPLLVGASGGGQLFLPDSVGCANILEHAVHEFPQLRRLRRPFAIPESINVLLNRKQADGDYSALRRMLLCLIRFTGAYGKKFHMHPPHLIHNTQHKVIFFVLILMNMAHENKKNPDKDAHLCT